MAGHGAKNCRYMMLNAFATAVSLNLTEHREQVFYFARFKPQEPGESISFWPCPL